MFRGLTGGFRLRNRRWYSSLFIALCIAFLAVGYAVAGKVLKIEWAVPILAAVGGLTTFLYSQHLQETRLFTELFKDFNARYDGLNKQLNKIRETAHAGIHGDDRQVLMDYLNLCAEEYLYFSAGYIDEGVWKSWARGMKFFAEAESIRKIWVQELASDSYYGFSLRELD
jgi:hypothetical protein